MLDQGYSAAEWTIQTPRCLTPWFNAGVAVPDPVNSLEVRMGDVAATMS